MEQGAEEERGTRSEPPPPADDRVLDGVRPPGGPQDPVSDMQHAGIAVTSDPCRTRPARAIPSLCASATRGATYWPDSCARRRSRAVLPAQRAPRGAWEDLGGRTRCEDRDNQCSRLLRRHRSRAAAGHQGHPRDTSLSRPGAGTALGSSAWSRGSPPYVADMPEGPARLDEAGALPTVLAGLPAERDVVRMSGPATNLGARTGGRRRLRRRGGGATAPIVASATRRLPRSELPGRRPGADGSGAGAGPRFGWRPTRGPTGCWRQWLRGDPPVHVWGRCVRYTATATVRDPKEPYAARSRLPAQDRALEVTGTVRGTARAVTDMRRCRDADLEPGSRGRLGGAPDPPDSRFRTGRGTRRTARRPLGAVRRSVEPGWFSTAPAPSGFRIVLRLAAASERIIAARAGSSRQSCPALPLSISPRRPTPGGAGRVGARPAPSPARCPPGARGGADVHGAHRGCAAGAWRARATGDHACRCCAMSTNRRMPRRTPRSTTRSDRTRAALATITEASDDDGG